MYISNLANRVEPSKGRQLFNMASKYDNVINLTLGDPDIIPPLSIREAGCSSIMEGKTRYSANAGMIELRRAYAQYLEKHYNKNFDPATEVMVTVGGMEGLYLAMISVVNPGDEVVIFAPYYINYYQMIQMCGATPIVVETREQDEFVPQVEEVQNAITDKTKLIVMNSPANPTGAVYSSDVVDGILKLAEEKDILVISDEVYSSLVYDDGKHYSVLQSKVSYENVLLIDSCSKKFSMTGWRVGFAAGPEQWVAAMTKLQENVAACAPLPSQYAALKAFEDDPDMTAYRKEFLNRRNALVSKLSQIPELTFSVPEGTFYLFVNIGKTGKTSMEFALGLLDSKQVAVVPGIAYGDGFDDYIRIAFTLKKEILEVAADKLIDYVRSLL